MYSILLTIMVVFTFNPTFNQLWLEVVTGALLLLYPIVMLISKKLR
ncbi:MAG: hypothetical protein NWE93_11185 [Candidatus Bathyarchaeota archaeon]|nr:hypothetical protein [Candidatus Bathyarchaeota archaeon]